MHNFTCYILEIQKSAVLLYVLYCLFLKWGSITGTLLYFYETHCAQYLIKAKYNQLTEFPENVTPSIRT